MKLKTILLFSLFPCLAFAQTVVVEPVPNQPYCKYELSTQSDRVTFYVSTTPHKEKMPLIVYVQGSGSNSMFSERDGKVVPAPTGFRTWYEVGHEKYRILVAEKPGVEYLQTTGSESFDRKFSLESWAASIVEAINYTIRNEAIDESKILIAGHSEGGIVVSRVANLMQGRISNVAVLAGEGPPQLYGLYKFAVDGTFFTWKERDTPEERIKYLTDSWQDILADPTATDKKFFGYTYLRWSSMSGTSVIEELTNYDGKILLVQGTEDKAVHPESAIVAYTTLLTKGKNVELRLIENADHSFHDRDKPEIDGWAAVVESTMRWFDGCAAQ